MDGELKLLLHGVRVVVVAFVMGLPAKPIIDMDAVVAAMPTCPPRDTGPFLKPVRCRVPLQDGLRSGSAGGTVSGPMLPSIAYDGRISSLTGGAIRSQRAIAGALHAPSTSPVLGKTIRWR